MATVTDDLGHALPLSDPRRRIVSLVPSLTESIAASRPGALVGATDWCTYPADLEVRRVRGTKNPDLATIIGLAPDLVLANKEENRRIDVERLRAAGVPVWVTDIETVDQALSSLRRVFTAALQWPVPTWLDEATAVWGQSEAIVRMSVAVPIWRDPWMVVGSRTFTGDLLARMGVHNVFAESADRYPRVSTNDILAATPDVVLLPDEPYRFTADDGPEVFSATRCVLVEGRALTWYGPSLATAAETVRAALRPRD